MVNDFYSQVDATTYATFTKVDFVDVLDQQAIYNGSGISIDVSFDGTTKHAVMGATGPTQAVTWDHHKRSAVWLRRTDLGSTGGPYLVDVYGARAVGYFR